MEFGNHLGAPIMPLTEQRRVPETGPLSVEQLVAVERRIVKRLDELKDKDETIERHQTLFRGDVERRFIGLLATAEDQARRDAARQMAYVDLVSRFASESVKRDAEVRRVVHEFEQHMIQLVYEQAGSTKQMITDFQQELYNRTLLGRCARLWQWLRRGLRS